MSYGNWQRSMTHVVQNKYKVTLNENIAIIQIESNHSVIVQFKFDEIFFHEADLWIVLRQNNLYFVVCDQFTVFHSNDKIIQFEQCCCFNYPYGIDRQGNYYLPCMKIMVRKNACQGSPYWYHFDHGSMTEYLGNIPDEYPNLREFQMNIEDYNILKLRNTRLYYTSSVERQYHNVFGENNILVSNSNGTTKTITLETYKKIMNEFGLFMGFGKLHAKDL